jgi:hypothetical protein
MKLPIAPKATLGCLFSGYNKNWATYIWNVFIHDNVFKID